MNPNQNAETETRPSTASPLSDRERRAIRAVIDSTWEHRCEDGIGGCTGVSVAALDRLREALEFEVTTESLAAWLVDRLSALPVDNDVPKLRPLYDAVLDYRTRRASYVAEMERA